MRHLATILGGGHVWRYRVSPLPRETGRSLQNRPGGGLQLRRRTGRCIGRQITQGILDPGQIMLQNGRIPPDLLIVAERAVEDASSAEFADPAQRVVVVGPVAACGDARLSQSMLSSTRSFSREYGSLQCRFRR